MEVTAVTSPMLVFSMTTLVSFLLVAVIRVSCSGCWCNYTRCCHLAGSEEIVKPSFKSSASLL
ncbi:unnamed protein product [Timema podura]|uniref:Secreted peptide n=1 Tax=Timema podura TaxID=61482 RepID=A0ABN7PAA2_TIMPD|nr:unnamed protein product [Timema podura]